MLPSLDSGMVGYVNEIHDPYVLVRGLTNSEEVLSPEPCAPLVYNIKLNSLLSADTPVLLSLERGRFTSETPVDIHIAAKTVLMAEDIEPFKLRRLFIQGELVVPAYRLFRRLRDIQAYEVRVQHLQLLSYEDFYFQDEGVVHTPSLEVVLNDRAKSVDLSRLLSAFRVQPSRVIIKSPLRGSELTLHLTDEDFLHLAYNCHRLEVITNDSSACTFSVVQGEHPVNALHCANQHLFAGLMGSRQSYVLKIKS